MWIVESAGFLSWTNPAKKASRREVTFGFKNIRDIEVLSGLKAGERVIVSSYKDWLKKDYIIIK